MFLPWAYISVGGSAVDESGHEFMNLPLMASAVLKTSRFGE